MRTGLCAALIIVGAAVIGACSESVPVESHFVRGEVIRAEYGGLALRVDHEEVPGVMDQMRMSFRLQSPEDARELQPGDKIRFVYVRREEGSYIRDIERLPPDTKLNLGEIGVQAAANTDDQRDPS